MNKNISTLEEMPGALSYLIWKVEGLEETIQTYHKINKALAFLQSEIDDWMKQRHCKSQAEMEQEALEYIKRHKTV